MKKLPLTLIYTRLFLGILLLALSYLQINHYRTFAVIFFSAGLLSDVFDGIVARRLNVSTPGLRRLDSTVDQAFFILVAVATFLQCPRFFHDHSRDLIILIIAEALTYVVCYIKFKKEIATHSIGSKIWALFLFATILQIMIRCTSGTLFQWCFYVGMITRLENVGIVLILRDWTTDVPSLFHAVRLRQGKPIKRHKLFNG